MEYNRDKDGKFAPKGTGDKTGFEKGFSKAMPKRGSAATEADISEALGDNAWKITDKTTAGEYAKEVADSLGVPVERVMEAIRKDTPNATEDSIMAEVAGLDERNMNTIEEWRKDEMKREPAEPENDSIVIGAWEDENTSINDNVGKWAKKNGYQVKSDVWGNQQLAKDGKLYGYKAKTTKDPEGKSIISIELEEQDERGEPVKKSVLPF